MRIGITVGGYEGLASGPRVAALRERIRLQLMAEQRAGLPSRRRDEGLLRPRRVFARNERGR